MVEQVVELVEEQIDRPEVLAFVGSVRRAPATELVVVDDRPTPKGERGQREHIVMGHTGSAVEHHQGGEWGLEVTGDPVPRRSPTKRGGPLLVWFENHAPTLTSAL